MSSVGCEIQVRGVAQPGTEVGYYANYDNDLFSFGDENIVGIKAKNIE